MTVHRFYLVVTTLYCMFAVATSASAECARVLSQETREGNQNMDEVLSKVVQTAAVESSTIRNMSAEEARNLFILGHAELSGLQRARRAALAQWRGRGNPQFASTPFGEQLATLVGGA